MQQLYRYYPQYNYYLARISLFNGDRFVCPYVYIDVILHVIVYSVSILHRFYCTFVLLSQQWLNEDGRSIDGSIDRNHNFLRHQYR